MQLVWDNCREYNEPDAPVVADADEAEAYWRQCWAATGVYVSPAELEAQAAAERAARQQAAAEKLDSTWRAAARKVGGLGGTAGELAAKAAGWQALQLPCIDSPRPLPLARRATPPSTAGAVPHAKGEGELVVLDAGQG